MAVESLIGELPVGWSPMKLGEACERGGGGIQTGPFGSQLHASDYVPVGLPSIMPANIGDNRVIEDGIARITEEDAERLARYRVRTGDIVYSRRGDVERRALIREQEDGWLCGTGCLRVRFGEGHVDPRFASYYLGHPNIREWIVRHAHGATMPNLNTSILSALPFVVPPRDEQHAIAHVLGTLDDKIELNRRMNETLEAMARAIFKSWFVDFDPVRAKASGEPPESICRRLGLTPDLLALFPDRLVDSELGEIPEGWEGKPFGEWLVHTIGGDWGAEQPDEQFGVEVRIIRGTDIPKLKGGMGEETPRRFIQASKFESRRLAPEDLVLEVSGGSKGQPTGRGLRVTERILEGLGGSVVPASFCRLLRPKSPDMGPLLGLHLDRIYEAGKTWEYQNQSTGISNFQTKYFLERELVVEPGGEVREAFSRLVTPFLSGQYLKESGALISMRDALLPMLLSGKLRVQQTEGAA